MSIWQFYDVLSQRLLTWNVVNILVGLALLPFRPFWRGLGSQSIGWGLINIGIALGGALMNERRFVAAPDPHAPDVVRKESNNLRTILWVNTGLDVLYMLGGLRWAQTRGQNRPLMRGLGWGIVVQGALLFVFDLIHALAVPQARRVR